MQYLDSICCVPPQPLQEFLQFGSFIDWNLQNKRKKANRVND